MHLPRIIPLVLALLAAAPLAAQHADGHATAAATDSVPPLMPEALGPFSWPVTTTSAEAQAYFDQGVKLMYAYARANARPSFAHARTVDPRCAMCWWGEAWSMGAYLNGAMDDADAPAANAAAQRARELAAQNGTELERALTVALTARYASSHEPEGTRKQLDSAYVRAMEDVYARFPDDLQVATLYADAMMLLEPRRGLWSLDKPSIQTLHGVLERGLARDIGHSGVCHAYIHATETTANAGRAQTCADLLVTAMPGASHLNHMPSHTYNRVGRWEDAVNSNLLAWETDRRAAAGQPAVSIYPPHNVHMLLFAASMDGQEARAFEGSDAWGALMPNGDGASLRALTRIRFGRWNDVLAMTDAPAHPIHRGLWAFARGYAHLRTGAADSAAAYLARVDSLAANSPNATFRTHTAERLLGVVAGILRGEIARTEGRMDDAVAAFEAAVALEDALQYDEPEPLPFAARDWLGATLLEAGRPADAERVYRAALDDRPHNGWSLFGLEQALRAQGRTAEADEALALFREAWTRSQTPLTASRF
ncbi:tetratricopeptide repeat protein [Longimicrobium sp.]|uniref:tetratricopeptide repeat protein n=1 Tax=Longimicrobium sp. TaxID=2029185 RepID=UPI002E3588A8|nr:tetratricopeptide repeat protein [Longimicrobium sp.]HEX6042333.1 tetratricopeptide repeat protein [Longimicrobium sp.]